MIRDTIRITNGLYYIRPDVAGDFFVSCSLKNESFVSHYGYENFCRICKKFEAESTDFEDSTAVIISIDIGRLADNFVDRYTIWDGSRQVYVSVRIGEGSSIPPATYTAYEGYVEITEMITVVA